MADADSVIRAATESAGSGDPTAQFAAAAQAAFGGAVTAPATGEPEATTETESTQQPAPPARVNWEDPSNPYIQRFKGLQGAIQREVERRRQLEQQMQQLENDLLQARVAHLPPAQREQALREQQQRLAQSRAYQQIVEQAKANEEVARLLITHMTAQKYGVRVEDIAHLPDPDSMERHAESLAALRENVTRMIKSAVTQNSGQFEGVARTSAPKPKPTADLNEAEQNFVHAAERLFGSR